MKLLKSTSMLGVAAAALLTSSPTWGQITLNENLEFTGYAVGSVRYFDTGDGSDSTIDMDATKLQTNIKFDPVVGVVSVYFPDEDDAELLDLYVTYNISESTTITAGKFLSYHGFEAFDIPNMLQISYANDLAAIIPGYHKGVKLGFASGSSSMGVAILDSVYGSDSNIDNGVGAEAYYSYSADALTAYVGVAYESEDESHDSALFDFWTSYAMGSLTLAGEIAVGTTDYDIGADVDSYFWLLLAEFATGDSGALVARVSGGEDSYDLGPDTSDEKFLKGTLAYRWIASDHLAVVSEFSYTDFSGDLGGDATFVGVQGRFTF